MSARFFLAALLVLAACDPQILPVDESAPLLAQSAGPIRLSIGGGCPDMAEPPPPQDVDSDGDGVLDSADQCPAVPAGPYPDRDYRRRGCPDTTCPLKVLTEAPFALPAGERRRFLVPVADINNFTVEPGPGGCGSSDFALWGWRVGAGFVELVVDKQARAKNCGDLVVVPTAGRAVRVAGLEIVAAPTSCGDSAEINNTNGSS